MGGSNRACSPRIITMSYLCELAVSCVWLHHSGLRPMFHLPYLAKMSSFVREAQLVNSTPFLTENLAPYIWHLLQTLYYPFMGQWRAYILLNIVEVNHIVINMRVLPERFLQQEHPYSALQNPVMLHPRECIGEILRGLSECGYHWYIHWSHCTSQDMSLLDALPPK